MLRRAARIADEAKAYPGVRPASFSPIGLKDL